MALQFKRRAVKFSRFVGSTFWITGCVVICLLWLPSCRAATPLGGTVTGQRTLKLDESPYNVYDELVVEPESQLTIEPGVTLRFAPGVGLTVKGALLAKGTEVERIIFTKQDSIHYFEETGPVKWPDVRLVDGESVIEGRLQIFYRHKWRSVCTNSRNWTIVDAQVVCRQLGFTGGNFTRWFERLNDSSQFMYENPNCTGMESGIEQCQNWHKRKMGSGVCDYHMDIGIRCDSVLPDHIAPKYWRGVTFLNAAVAPDDPYYREIRQVGKHVSMSVLENVTISFAGSEREGNVTSALRIIGVPPYMKSIHVLKSAYTGLNVTDLKDGMIIDGGVFAENRGYGIFINTSSVNVNITSVTVKDNGADGIRFVHHDPFNFFITDKFDYSSSLGSQQEYPVYLELYKEKSQEGSTCRPYEIHGFGAKVTAHFWNIQSSVRPEDEASTVVVYDGLQVTDPLLGSFEIRNNTKPQTLTSTGGYLHICLNTKRDQKLVFTLEVIGHVGETYDLNVTACNITNNNGRGIWIQDMRTGIAINQSTVNENQHVAGVHIDGGVGNVIINKTIIKNNIGDGLNVSFSGGQKIIQDSVIKNNTFRGLSFWFNESAPYVAFNHLTRVSNSIITENYLAGILAGNFCRVNSFWNISMNIFRSNKDDSIVVQSCWKKKSPEMDRYLIDNNLFTDNERLGIRIKPALYVSAEISWNNFVNHRRGALLISNYELDDLNHIPTRIIIQRNTFEKNSGMFVANIGVGEGSTVQEVNFMRNKLRENTVREPFQYLNPRSRVAAAVVVSSSNTRVFRNFLVNPGSKYELGVHLESHSKMINGTLNFWGKIDSPNSIYERIFDRKDRYNLARVEFMQYLVYGSDLDTTSQISNPFPTDLKMPFINRNVIGGEVAGEEIVKKGDYVVQKDIFVLPDSKLILEPGVTLAFEKSVGIMVQGKLESSSETESTKIRFVASGTASLPASQAASGSVRLSNRKEGRLEVQVAGKWGSVCSYGWGIEAAAIACNQLGLVLNPQDWILEKSQFPQKNNLTDVILSNVHCADTDTNLLDCKAEHLEDFEASCLSEVGLRCYPPSWSGIRLGMLADQSILKNVVIEKAGLLDYSTHAFRPALQIDFHQHHIEHVTIQDNTDSGLGIMWNNMFAANPKVSDCTFTKNAKHGIVAHSQALEVFNSKFQNNAESGFHYDPMVSRREQKDLVGWIVENRKQNVLYLHAYNDQRLFIHEDKPIFLHITKESTSKDLTFETNTGRCIGIMILNPIHDHSTEKLVFYHPDIGSPSFWDVQKMLTAFPFSSPGYKIAMRYESGNSSLGGAILYLASVPAPPSFSSQKTQLILYIHDNEFDSCGHGFSSNHYNWHISSHGDHYHRYGNETILMEKNTITQSTKEAIFVHTPFWEPRQSSLAEINYTLNANDLTLNQGGIVQYNRDIRQSNNLFHWLINDTKVVDNLGGGFNIRLPYVWQYSENQTHTVVVENSTFSENQNFDFVVDGHFSKVNISRNVFERNRCMLGLLTMTGMEKQMHITENKMRFNSGQHVVCFNIHSHAEKFGAVQASFERNIVKENLDGAERNLDLTRYQPKSYALSVKGVQNINISHNIFMNPSMQFELLAGIYAGSLNNTLNATQNYWGFVNETQIKKRIFDFDDWNNYAIVNFDPVLGLENIDGGAVTITRIPRDQYINVQEPFGGRLFKSLYLNRASKPYVIDSDLTVMPGVTLTIETGAVLDFYPSVGILVLGNLVVKGSEGNPVKMRPAQQMAPKMTFARSPSSRKTNVRLCLDVYCEHRGNNGFLEVYNQTTLQWVPVCDPRFTERNAQVVCRELGYSTLNVHYRFGSRNELGVTELKHIRFWPEPLECSGQEKTFASCELRLNGFGNHSYECVAGEEEFVYIACNANGKLSGEEYWGGIRFAQPAFEDKIEDYFTTPHTYIQSESVIRHLEIQGAGILHGEKMAAIQIIRREVDLRDIQIKFCASHGIETIAPPSVITYRDVEAVDNLGTGMNIFVLSGSASDAEKLLYYPLTQASLPYHIFGLVDICDTNKELVISQRVLIYYKYDNMPVDCVKIITSSSRSKKVGFRLLHFNLFNATDYAAQPDFIRIYDGDIFGDTGNRPIGEIGVTEELRQKQPELKFYRSRGMTLSIQFHASGASGTHGFVAEVVTVPVTHYIGRGLHHNISFCELSRNVLGGIVYQSAGEGAPALSIRQTRFVDNGQKLFGNFTTIDAAALLFIQNTRDLMFRNNLLLRNQGGLFLHVAAESTASTVHGLIVNNLFTENSNRETLHVRGRHSGYYQKIEIKHNYFARNDAAYRDNIVLAEISSIFSRNLVVENKGKHQMDLLGFPKISLSSQLCESNWFFKNEAGREGEFSTIYAASAGQKFRYNYFVNIDNIFEILAANRTLIDSDLNEDDEMSVIDARENWWGFSYPTAVSGRIKDGNDFRELLVVTYLPFLENNYTVIHGNCSGGWTKIGDTCFLYVGGRMTHEEARKFCEKDNASMPYLRVKEDELIDYMRQQQVEFSRENRVWIRSIDVPHDKCGVFRNGHIEKYDCDKTLPFLCEKDPERVEFGARPWYRDPLTIASVVVASVVFIFLLVCISFSVCKSRRRYKEKLERRNSIRASLRSLQSAGTGYGELGYRRRLEKLGKVGTIKPTVIKVNNGSIDSISKTQISSSSMEDTRSFDFSESKAHEEDSPNFVTLNDHFRHDPQLENETANAMAHPTFDLTYENHGFRDHFTSRNGSGDWSTGSNSTLDIKRSLERSRDNAVKDTSTFRPTPSPPSEYQEPVMDYQSRTSTFRGGGNISNPEMHSNRDSGGIIYSNVSTLPLTGSGTGNHGTGSSTPSVDNSYNNGRQSRGSNSNGNQTSSTYSSDTYKSQFERRPLETAM